VQKLQLENQILKKGVRGFEKKLIEEQHKTKQFNDLKELAIKTAEENGRLMNANKLLQMNRVSISMPAQDSLQSYNRDHYMGGGGVM